jgi:hypothetical protein
VGHRPAVWRRRSRRPGEERHRRHPAVAVSYGAGLALIVDEFALLLDLRDVYWARKQKAGAPGAPAPEAVSQPVAEFTR